MTPPRYFLCAVAVREVLRDPNYKTERDEMIVGGTRVFCCISKTQARILSCKATTSVSLNLTRDRVTGQLPPRTHYLSEASHPPSNKLNSVWKKRHVGRGEIKNR